MSSTLGRYRILTKLAEGGMGKVYLAALGGPGECPKLSVLKTLKGSLAADRRLRQAFIEEGRLSVRLQHPNIVAAYEVFEEGAVPIMALEYLDGQPLDRIRRDHARSLPLGLHLRILTEALRGLEYFHGLEDIDATPLHPVHRDVSPQNIFVTYTGEVKVLDFGIAKAAHVAGTDETEVGIFKGKLRYIAPEQMRVDLGSAASAADRRSDLYALGVLLWEAIAGRGRWDGVSEGDIFLELLTGSSPCLTPELPGATPAVRALLAKATARAPHARFATASEMREATLAVVDAEMVEAGSDALSRWLTSRYADAKAKRKRLIAERLMELDAGDKGSHLSSWPVEASAPTVSATKMGRRVGRTPDRHLPAVVTGIVGRAAEIASVTTLLERSRLVTLTGPGGIGKTRLAVEVARLGSANFADGVRFVPLGATVDATLVTSAVAAALGVTENARGTLRDSVLASLQDKELLLLLDNFEHVLSSAPLVSAVLAAAPGVRVLVSSREPLRLSGEHLFAVPPLSVPDGATVEHALRHAAVELFMTRAQAARFDFVLHPANVGAVVALCKALDGLPLAIEIAAARVDRFDVRELLKVGEGTWLEAQGPVDLPERQRTLRHVIGWSYSHVDAPTQALFRSVSVFAGGATLDAIERVGGGVPSTEERIGALVSKSLVLCRPAPGGGLRYAMLETIRAFAQDEIRRHGEDEAVRQRHAAYYAEVALRQGRRVETASQRDALEMLSTEAPNLRLALTEIERTDAIQAAEVALALAGFWELRGYWSEGMGRLDAIASLPKLPAALRASCLAWGGRMSRHRGDQDGANRRLEGAMQAAHEADGAEHVRAMVHHELGQLALLGLGDGAESMRHFELGLARFRRLKDDGGIAETLVGLAYTHYCRADHATTQEFAAEAIAIARGRGDPRLIASATNILGLAARARGEYAAAEALFEEEMAVSEAADHKPGILDALVNMAEFARSRSDMERAEVLYQRYITACQDLGNPFPTGRAIKDLGEIARYRGDYELAEGLYKRALALADESGNTGEGSWVRRALAEVAIGRGKSQEARRQFIASISSRGTATHRMLLMLCLCGLAAVAVMEGDDARAARLIGAAEPIFEREGLLLAGDDRADYEARVSMVRQRIVPVLYEKEHGLGRAMSLPEMIDFACATASCAVA